ncbi:signal peptide peptidase SppA [Moraxella nasovis]|uniref:signal peptide peptidase SppA n=1 Tax=Moraxella nasovis TaxID=2904121 RepID=UPI001F60CE5C|nr:signal peptide peptidase SppA [Moraxella nasovis]UNU72995.1 signal peptide peptidase SppA [Moraxella nasovis]
MAWPPNPNKTPTSQAVQTDATRPTTKEWHLLEKTLLASIDEQRRSRRWSIFFKILTFLYIAALILLLSQCSTTTPTTGMAMPIDASEPHLAVVHVHGAITDTGETSAHNINAALIDAFENVNAKAIALDINSPGGSPVQSDEIWQMVMDLRQEHPDKKVYAVIGDIGASGAYYIASAADEIWVNPSSLVGSIGVIMSSYNVKGLMDKVGVSDTTMTAGEYKDILSSTRAMSDKERTHVQNVLNATHQNFINAVKKGRGDKLKDPEKNQIFTGLFWAGSQSVELGLADKLGGMMKLKKQLDLPDVDYSYTDPMQRFFDRFGVQMGKGLGEGVKVGLQEQSQAQLQ